LTISLRSHVARSHGRAGRIRQGRGGNCSLDVPLGDRRVPDQIWFQMRPFDLVTLRPRE